jgi:hypothetical protein
VHIQTVTSLNMTSNKVESHIYAYI